VSTAPGILDRVPDDLRGKLPEELVDELLAGAKADAEIVGPGGLLGRQIGHCSRR
jgi:hypothetical protein